MAYCRFMGAEALGHGHSKAERQMYARLLVLTVLIAMFGIAMSYVAQRSTPGQPASFVASISGGTCDYSSGTLCKINRGGTAGQAKF